MTTYAKARIRIVPDIEQKQDDIAAVTGGGMERITVTAYGNAPVLTNIFISSGCLCTVCLQTLYIHRAILLST